MDKCVRVLDDTRKMSWETRERALIQLQHMFESVDENSLENISIDSLNTLRRPLDVQLRDLRSAIVRETCKLIIICNISLGKKFTKCALHLVGTLLEVITSGNKVIATHCDQCLQELFLNSRLHPQLPKLLKTLTTSKNKDTRDMCIVYLRLIFEHWSTKVLSKHIYTLEDSMLKLVQDSSENVRSTARICFLMFEEHFPESFQTLVPRLDERTLRAIMKCDVAVHHGDTLNTGGGHESFISTPTKQSAFTTSTSTTPTTITHETKDETDEEVSEQSGPSSHIASSSSNVSATPPSAPRRIPSKSTQEIPDSMHLSRLISLHRSRLNVLFESLGKELEMLKHYEQLETSCHQHPNKLPSIISEYETKIQQYIADANAVNEQVLSKMSIKDLNQS